MNKVIIASIAGTKIWWYSCFGAFISLLAFSSVMITYYLKDNRLSWNVVSTEEGR